MKFRESQEMYLETILLLKKNNELKNRYTHIRYTENI